jgi:hypothetical protein
MVDLAAAVETVSVLTPNMRAVRLPQVRVTLVALVVGAQQRAAAVVVKAAQAQPHRQQRVPPTAATVAQRAQV